MKPLLYESHAHTPLCKHAVGHPSEYASAAERQGLKGLIVTCHNPMPNGFSSGVRMAPREFEHYVDLVELTAISWQERVDVLLGLEADYFVGYEAWLEKQLNAANFHFVLGSVHPQTIEFRSEYWNGDPIDFQRTYFRLLAEAAETKLFDSLAHPDLVKNETARDWNPDLVMDDIRRALDRIAVTGVAMELNTSGCNKTIAEMNPFPAMLHEISVRGIPITLGADAHAPSRVGDRFVTALNLLRECGFENVSVFRSRKRTSVLIDDAIASIMSNAEQNRELNAST